MNEPKRASELLRGIVRELGRGVARRDVNEALDAALPPHQRSSCQVVAFRGGKLVVQVDSAPLYAELTGYRKEQLRTRLNELLPADKVAVLQFRLGGTAHV